MQNRAEGNRRQVVDGSEITELVENEKVFTKFVDHKFRQLDGDGDGKLSVQELKPAVSDLGAALGLPAKGSSPESDQIYNEVLEEFTHGNQKSVTKTHFKEVLSDFLLGMADGLKRDPVVILRIDGQDLDTFLRSSTFEPEMLSTFSEIESSDEDLRAHLINAFRNLNIDQGMPPPSDPWVISNIVKPAVDSLKISTDQRVSDETFLMEFKRAAENVVQLLKERPAIVAHAQNTFTGNGIKRLFSNPTELNKAMDAALLTIPRERKGKIGTPHLRAAFDLLAASVDLPPLGAVPKMDELMNGALKMVEEDVEMVKEEEFRKLLREVLGSIMLQLEGCPVSFSTDSVIHQPLSSTSFNVLQP